MIHPYEWPDHFLLITLRNRSASFAFLLHGVTQQAFFEHWTTFIANTRPGEGREQIIEMQITVLNSDSYDLLEPHYSGDYLLEG